MIVPFECPATQTVLHSSVITYLPQKFIILHFLSIQYFANYISVVFHILLFTITFIYHVYTAVQLFMRNNEIEFYMKIFINVPSIVVKF